MFGSLQYLRAIASLMVVVFHIRLQLERIGYAGWWPTSWENGVDLFFVLSGFLMMVTTEGTSGHAVTFALKRLIRIAPLYWIVTTVFVAMMLIAPGLVHSGGLEPWHVVASYLFLPAQHPSIAGSYPVVVLGWTLNYEMFFYLVWALALVLPNRWRVPAAAGVLITLVALGVVLRGKGLGLSFYTSPILLEFVYGLALGAWYLKAGRLPVPLGVAALVAGFALLLTLEGADDQTRALVWGAPALIVVGGALILEKAAAVPRIPILTLLGNASYSIYLVQGVALAAASRAWAWLPFTHFPGAVWVFAACCLLSATASGLVVHILVERPLLKLMSRRVGVTVAGVVTSR